MKMITIGKRIIPLEQIAFVEPFEPSRNPDFRPEKDFKGRLVLINRDIILMEQTPEDFAKEHELPLLAEDGVALNRTLLYSVERFEPTDGFNPAKPYKTRIKWKDLAGGEQSKLLLTEAEAVIVGLSPAKASPQAKRAAGRYVAERAHRAWRLCRTNLIGADENAFAGCSEGVFMCAAAKVGAQRRVAYFFLLLFIPSFKIPNP